MTASNHLFHRSGSLCACNSNSWIYSSEGIHAIGDAPRRNHYEAFLPWKRFIRNRSRAAGYSVVVWTGSNYFVVAICPTPPEKNNIPLWRPSEGIYSRLGPRRSLPICHYLSLKTMKTQCLGIWEWFLYVYMSDFDNNARTWSVVAFFLYFSMFLLTYCILFVKAYWMKHWLKPPRNFQKPPAAILSPPWPLHPTLRPRHPHTSLHSQKKTGH